MTKSMLRFVPFLMAVLMVGYTVGCGSSETEEAGGGNENAAGAQETGDQGASSEEAPAESNAPAEGEKTTSSEPSEPTTFPPTPNPSTEPAPSTKPKKNEETSPEPTTASSSSDEPSVQAIKTVFAGLQENRPEAVWEYLPASYQKDVNDIVHLFAEKMDSEIWKRSFGTLQDAVKVMKTQKEFILKHPSFQKGPVKPEELSANWDALVDFLDTLVTSEISELEKLKSLDTQKFLAGTGKDLMDKMEEMSALAPQNPFENQFKQKLADSKITVVSSEGDSAVLKLEAPGQPPQEKEFVKVEGKWIPKDMADNWKAGVERAKTQLNQITKEQLAQIKPKVLKTLDQLDGVIAKLQNAKNAQEFNLALNQAMAPVMGMMMGIMGGGPGGPGGPGGLQPGQPGSVPMPPTNSQDGVKVLVQGEIKKPQQESILKELKKHTDAGDNGFSSYSAQKVNGTLIINISPVKNVDAFAKKIQFGKVVNVDKKNRAVTVEFSGEAKKDQ